MRAGLLAAVGVAAIAWGGTVGAQAPGRARTPAPVTVPAPPPVPSGPPQTLRDALVSTYGTNPTIMAQRQSLRATDEGSAIARAAGRPQIAATAGVNQDVLTDNTAGLGRGRLGRDFSVGATIAMPLYAGGTIRNSVRAADTRVEAGRADLRATEGDTFTEAVAAYMDVIRDRVSVQLNQNQVRVLETNLQATRDRFEVGDLTRTDVAQSDARLALARSLLSNSQGRLESSEENFRRVIGFEPGDLQPPPPLPTLPGTADQAVGIALGNNADLAAIASRARAAGYDVRVARGERLPTISAVGNGSYFNQLHRADEAAELPEGTLPNSVSQATVGLSLRMPLYQGGAAGARVRQAQAIRTQLLEQAVGVERLVISSTNSAFAGYQAALAVIASQEIAVAANQLALEGTRAEQSVGTRNILDVLNAEQELLTSQQLLVAARRDAYVSGFQLLNVMGQAEAEDLNLDGGPLYDPLVNYNRYARSWSDWDDGPPAVPVSTRTAPAGSNSPVTQPPVTAAPQ
ncbi:MAG TPA: TolC family outer membrane protein [Allosphingosinicella sp.]